MIAEDRVQDLCELCVYCAGLGRDCDVIPISNNIEVAQLGPSTTVVARWTDLINGPGVRTANSLHVVEPGVSAIRQPAHPDLTQIVRAVFYLRICGNNREDQKCAGRYEQFHGFLLQNL